MDDQGEILDYDEDYDEYVAKQKEQDVAKATEYRRKQPTRIAIYVALVVLVLCLGVLLGFPYGFSSNSAEPTIDWSHQDQVPASAWSSDGDESSAEIETAAERITYEYGIRAMENPDAPAETVVIPQDQRVVIVGRFSFGAELLRTPANSSGSFTQTCVIERGGTLTLIGHDSGRALYSYTSPGYITAPFDEKCIGIEYFFEKLN